MRITSRLMVQRKGFWFKTIWKKKSKFKIMAEANHVPPALTEAGIQPVDPLEEIKTKRATKVCNDWMRNSCKLLKNNKNDFHWVGACEFHMFLYLYYCGRLNEVMTSKWQEVFFGLLENRECHQPSWYTLNFAHPDSEPEKILNQIKIDVLTLRILSYCC